MSWTSATPDGPASDAGVVFPREGGSRSTMTAGRHVIAAATRRVDTAIHEAARDEPDWRRNYLTHFLELTRLSAQQHASLIAADGLRAVHTEFQFLRSGAELPLPEALAFPRANFLQSWSVTGSGSLPPGLTIPYHGTRLL